MKKNIPEETLENIVVAKLFFKKSTKEICDQFNLSQAFVNATVAAYRLIGEGNWEKIRFMIDGKQATLETVEWAAMRQGIVVPDRFYVKEEPPKEEPPKEELDGQTMFPEFIKLDKAATKTIWALIDALEKNAMECGRLADLMVRR